MPLPKPPTKKADLLAAADYESQAAPKPRKRTLKAAAPEAVPEQAPLELHDGGAVVSARRPAPLPAPAPAAPTPAPAPTPRARTRSPRGTGPVKLFVLDTNVLMHDPTCLFRFDEHDVFLPMITLEELDGHKKGMSEVARNARQVSRELDALATFTGENGSVDSQSGIPLAKTGHREAGGKLFFQTMLLDVKLPAGLPQGKADNQILGVVQALREQRKDREVVLVSKDINMRVKARALGLPAEDYFNDKTLEDGDLLYTGVLPLPADFWERHGKTMESWQQGGNTFYRISGPLVPALLINQFVYLETPGAAPLYARVAEITGKTAVLKTLRDYTHGKNAVWGVTARNREQNFALNLLMDPECDFVTLTGTAGTGKTLMTLAAGLAQVLDERRYSEIIVTRVTVPVGDDIGFLPGNEEEKMGPWMGALDDNLEVLARSDASAGEWGRAATNDLVRAKIKIKSLNFMRGRTFLNKYVIIDEAQNLTPKQMKTLITRAGPGTKIVCLGNLAQIDTPYLTEGSSGLTYAVDRFKGWPHGGHLTLARGERSRLADFASEVL
ncbi:PhoH family protein [Rubrivivax gelatinosus]|uniref:PhoH-like ATPase n=1 Tax=Rubrivivax gelatinosus TaxID=28068 RepID=A0A4R2MLW7_RUBGE|nr:PhoH family protein [Rubrivivax gelatinosus]MBK1685960.1 ribonuclease [Rubrivivax gelatinosus]TCP04016.1 PhoH-like ATPase [Rubrivivax gelatinosus]